MWQGGSSLRFCSVASKQPQKHDSSVPFASPYHGQWWSWEIQTIRTLLQWRQPWLWESDFSKSHKDDSWAAVKLLFLLSVSSYSFWNYGLSLCSGYSAGRHEWQWDELIQLFIGSLETRVKGEAQATGESNSAECLWPSHSLEHFLPSVVKQNTRGFPILFLGPCCPQLLAPNILFCGSLLTLSLQ